MSHLMRDDAPLTGSEWRRIDDAVVTAARRNLIGRRFIPIFGPLGPGTESVQFGRFSARSRGSVSLSGHSDAGPAIYDESFCQPLPMLYGDFVLYWRNIEWSRMMGAPLDTGAVTDAVVALAQLEDDLIFNGNADLGLEGIFNASGRNTIALGDWEQGKRAFDDVVAAVSTLTDAGHTRPYVLVLSPKLFGLAHRIFDNTGVLEIKQIKGVLGGGVYPSPAVKDKAAVISLGAENMDLAIGQDMVTAYLTAEYMNHIFRVMETITLRIKRADAICTLE